MINTEYYTNKVLRNGKNEIVDMDMNTLAEPAEFIRCLSVEPNQYGSAGRYDITYMRFGESEPSLMTLSGEDFERFFTPTVR